MVSVNGFVKTRLTEVTSALNLVVPQHSYLRKTLRNSSEGLLRTELIASTLSSGLKIQILASTAGVADDPMLLILEGPILRVG
jgi:hypothetical protein